MKRTLLFLLLATAVLFAQAQQTKPQKSDPNADIRIDEPVGNADVKQVGTDDPNKIYTAVEQSPQFPGGMQKLGEYIKTNLKYPPGARNNNVQGKVFVNFVVEKDGSLTDPKIVRGIGSGCDEEVLRLIKSSPKWKPGVQNGRVVRVYYIMPISFSMPLDVVPVIPGKGDPNADIVIDAPATSSNVVSMDNNKVFTAVEKEPIFPGGIQKLYEYLKTNLKYPAAARDNNVQGKVFVTFVVEKDGTLSDLKVLRGIGSGCDEEAIRLLKNGPHWNPGMQGGRPVRVQYQVPVPFQLQED